MTEESATGAGIEVVSVDDPGRRGRIVGGPRSRTDAMVYRIQWNDGLSSWMPEYAFERVDSADDDVFTLLDKQRFGRLNDLRRNLTFIQLSGRLANVVYSMDTTNTDFLPYQYKPVLTFLESPSNGLLIADEVGLGKTIEAGLIWTELRARYDARRLVVICPAILRDKWVLELDTRFGVESSQLNAGELAGELKRNKHEIRDGKGYVCSLQGLRPPSGWRNAEKRNGRIELAHLLEELTESEPVIDLLVIDEAHYLRNSKTQSAALGRLLREVSEHIVLLSATPVNNRAGDLYQLLRLVDPDSFYTDDQFPQVLSANEPLIRARNLVLDPDSTGNQIQEQLQVARQHPLLEDNRQLQGLLSQGLDSAFLSEAANRVELANRIERINLLRHTINRTRKVEVQEWKVVRKAVSHFVDLDPDGPERSFYNTVTGAVREYALDLDVSDGFLLSPPQRQMSSCMYAAARSWADRSSISDLANLQYEDFGTIESSSNGVGPLIEHIVNEVLPGFDIESLRKHDTKFKRFRTIVTGYLVDNPGEKLIVFSYFKATLNYLHERLLNLGVSSQVLHGGVPENKQAAIDRFRNSRDTRVLLTSEIASEGVDLQFCSLLINYDLPWNPMKIEQRIGRIDRIGQRAEKILIWSMGYADTIDERIYSRLLEKLDIFERALGGMEVILGELINELTGDLMSQELTPEQEESRIEQTYLAAENVRQQQDELEASAGHLIAHGDHILERVRAAHEFRRRITEYDLKAFVKDYLDRYVAGFEFQENDHDPLIVSIQLPPDFATRLSDYIRAAHLQGKSRLAGGESIRCQFLNKIDRITPKLEVISQFHPLIRFISSDLRERSEAFYPLVAVKIPFRAAPFVLGGVYAFVCKRWSFTGLRTDEILQTRAISLNSDGHFLDGDQSWNLVNAAKVEGSDWLSATQEISVERLERIFDMCDVQLLKDYEIARRDRTNENSDRVNLQQSTAARHRDRLLVTQRELLDRYQLAGRQRLIPMTEGRIRAIKRRFALHLERLRQQGEMTSSVSDVCYGVIRVVDHEDSE